MAQPWHGLHGSPSSPARTRKVARQRSSAAVLLKMASLPSQNGGCGKVFRLRFMGKPGHGRGGKAHQPPAGWRKKYLGGLLAHAHFNADGA